jgi:hypothetical protein
MKPRNGAIVALLLLATCNEEAQKDAPSNLEAKVALGVVPPSEVAAWQKVGSSTTPDPRYLQAVAFDETRKVVVMFGGTNADSNTGTTTPNKETWEWSTTTGKWTNRTIAGSGPDARSGAAMVFDSVRGKFVLFGGRSGSGYNFEDTWEWDPTTGAWTDVSGAGAHPTARSQHGMVYEKSTGKILLFGGGRSDSSSYDATGMSVSLGDTWECDPTTYVWTARTVTGAPTVRHDFGMVWDSSRNKAVLFAGLQTDIAGAAGVPKQDTWEWDPAASTWTERTIQGTKPTQRYAHAMAFDATRVKVVVFGGSDISTGGSRNDLWDWDPTTGAWVQRLSGSESGAPPGRMYASMVSDDARARLELVAGEVSSSSSYGTGGYYGSGGSIGMPPGMGGSGSGSRDVWELDPTTPVFTNRTPPLDVPSARYNQAMAYNPSTGKTYIFGGYDMTSGQSLGDLWEWDGKTWAPVVAAAQPPARVDAGMAYDPVRKSLILFGGTDYNGSTTYGDTWEWDSTSRKWTQLTVSSSPDPRSGHGMVTDTTRNKILLFGGGNDYYTGTLPGPYMSPMRNDVWEWDGVTLTWTNRTPVVSSNAPSARQYPVMAYDEGRQKLFLYDSLNYSSSPSLFWEWDPLSAGWATRDTNEPLQYGYYFLVAYDSQRRREVLLTDPSTSNSSARQTWEVDSKGPTWYVRSLAPSPGASYGATMVFDKGRGVAVLFGGESANTGYATNETWEYKVSNLGNGEGCTAATAATCATGFCVDGVCCEAAACTGACKSCNVAGLEGTCILAKAGTEVAGSCSTGLACDGSGNCLAKNGQVCTSATTCASGFCADGVCCDSACTGTCVSCNQTGQVGKCSAYAAGSDPQGECGMGTGVCRSTCDGVGSCAYAGYTVPCGNCMTCDGAGTCSYYDPYCGSYGGAIGYGGSGPNYGGAIGYGGSGPNYGGAGGYATSKGGAPGYGGNSIGRGGSGGSIPNVGGAGGSIIPNVGGSGGAFPGFGGAGGAVPSVGGNGGGVGDAGNSANLHKSGCGCDLGQAELAGAGLTTPLFVLGAALLLARKRRRKG